MLLTGCRRGEALAMRWRDVNLSDGTWSRQAADLKGRRAHKLPLSPAVIELLSTIRAEQSAGEEHVFPGAGSTGHLVSVKRAWRGLCRSADIKDARLHDLHHSHAALLASGGASLPLIGSLLGHASAASTQRYSSLFLDPQRRAVEMVAAALDLDGTGLGPAEVVKHPSNNRRGR
jgi:integrase